MEIFNIILIGILLIGAGVILYKKNDGYRTRFWIYMVLIQAIYNEILLRQIIELTSKTPM